MDLVDKLWGGATQLQKSLRNTPTVYLDCPAMVLVGNSNIEKSSIVHAISWDLPR